MAPIISSRRANLVMLLTVVVVLVMTSTVSGVVYDVGDQPEWGWGFHRDDPNYESFTSSKTFYVGDIIRFNYDSKYHNVMQVLYPDYVSCNATRPLATYTTGDDAITLKRSGRFYFICGIPDHCNWGGMKVIIDVVSPPVAAPVPTHSFDVPTSPPPSHADHHPHRNSGTGAVVHNVGDSSGWTTIGHVDYKIWAASNSFHVGDTLHFKYHAEYHNVMQVIYPDYISCNTRRPLATYSTGDDYIPIKNGSHYYYICGKPGHCQNGKNGSHYYYICGKPGHCQNGMKLDIHPSPRAH